MNSKNSTFSLLDSSAIIIGIIVGMGIFETPPIIASSLPNQYWVYAVWILGAFLSFIGALCLTEIALFMPGIGGDYHFLRIAYGEYVAFSFAWARTFVIGPGSLAALSFPLSSYLKKILIAINIPISPDIPLAYIAFFSIVIFTTVNFLGVRVGEFLQNFLSFIAIFGIISIAISGFFVLTPFLETTTLVSSEKYDFTLSLILVLFCFGGWNEIVFISSEIDN